MQIGKLYVRTSTVVQKMMFKIMAIKSLFHKVGRGKQRDNIL